MVRALEHGVGILRRIRNGLKHVPVLDDLRAVIELLSSRVIGASRPVYNVLKQKGPYFRAATVSRHLDARCSAVRAMAASHASGYMRPRAFSTAT
jgi:hypothetical protein